MNKVFKITLLVLCLFGFTRIDVCAQQNHFVYIQSDDKLPFDVSVNGQTYNSSLIGYVIVPKLAKGNYQINISFPNKTYPDQQFTCLIDKADAGFMLKNYVDKGWGLYNLQTLDIIMAGGAVSFVTEATKPVVNDGAFGNMLSEVADDSTLNLKTEPVRPQEEKMINVADTVSVIKDDVTAAQKNEIKIDDGNAAEKKDSFIPLIETINIVAHTPKVKLIKITQFTTTSGTDMVFLDSSAGLNDTIRIFLPVPTESIPATKNELETPPHQQVADTVKINNTILQKEEIIVKKNEPDTDTSQTGAVRNPFFAKDDQKNLVINNASASNPSVIENDKNITDVNVQPHAHTPDCKNIFAENEMDKLRKKMVSADNDEKMIGIVKKNLQDKCITTDQVKSLGALFLSDDGRYNFFNTVSPSVYDIAAFSSLESQLIDPNYKRRFRDLFK